jgi:hypothetical protein
MNPKTYIENAVHNITENESHRESPFAKAIENQTAKLPSDTFLWLAIGSMAASATLQVIGKKETSNFIGQWAPAFLILGLYNKLVRVAGSEGEKLHHQYSDTQESAIDRQGGNRLSPSAQESGVPPMNSKSSLNSFSSKKSDRMGKSADETEGLQQSSGL